MNNELKSLKEIPVPREPSKPVPIRERIHVYDPRPKEMVVNSESIKWKPVDIVAARVVSKVPWHCQPPPGDPKFMSKDKGVLEPIKRPALIKSKTVRNENGALETLVDSDGTTIVCAGEAIKAAPKTLGAAEQLVERAREATDTLSILISNMGPGWMEFQEVMNKGIVNARQIRIAMELENRQLMASLREVRNFFLDDQHEKDITKLREFVSLCQQLKEVKDSGFLDLVADTILKLGTAPEQLS